MFNAMTVGSFKTMPCPRVYTSVLAVPRSMARSLARAGLPLVALLRCQRAKALAELVDPRGQATRLAVTDPEDETPQNTEHNGGQEVQQVAHRSSTTSTGWA